MSKDKWASVNIMQDCENCTAKNQSVALVVSMQYKNISLVSQGLRSFFIEGGAYGTEWPKVMAASAVIVVPLLIMFAFTQKWFINGIGGDTGVKG